MRQMLLLVAGLVLFSASYAQDKTLVVYANQGYINEIIEADTLADGTQAHDVYQLATLDTTYKFSGALTIKNDITITGILDPSTSRPPCIQPTVLEDRTIPPTIFTLNNAGIKVFIENLYLLAIATNNTANGDGIAIRVTADNVRLTIDNCVFDGWQAFGIGYNGNWDDFFITDCHFRNFVHPNQWYVGEVIRNEWPGEAYTDTISMVGNTMLCVNGYAACPVTKYYETYFEFINNKVLYTFKNPFFIFNVTNAKINDNIFYGNYAGGVDQTEHPWWDNLWVPDSSYGVIALQPLSGDNAKLFQPQDSANAEGLRNVEVLNNVYYWPTELTDFWDTWNSTQDNWIRTPVFMNEPTVAMFANDTDYPYLTASNNINADPGFMAAMDDEIQNGTTDRYNIGFFDYFEQVRTGTTVADIWGYQLTDVGTAEDWVPIWPLPESAHITGIEEDLNLSVPTEFALNSIYPNPFNPSTNISYTLNKSGNTSLDVYNVLGQCIKTLVNNEFQTVNTYNVSVDMSDFSSGLYFVVLRQGVKTSTKKMMLLK